jgi:hypothetical protein
MIVHVFCCFINGWPDDPVLLQPFDCHFNAKRIIKTWIVVGFMPMTGNAANGPKVRYTLGEGGAPPEASDWFALHAEYKRAGDALMGIGLNGAMLDIELPKAKPAPVFVNDETRINHIIGNHLINKTGDLYKTGLIVVNCRVVVEAAKWVATLEKRPNAAAVMKKATKAMKRNCEAQKAHADWVVVRRLVDEDSNLCLNKKDSHATIKFLLPRLDIEGESKLKDFSSMKACVRWLGEIAPGMSWDDHMVAAMNVMRAEWEAEGDNLGVNLRLDTAPIFELGGV